MINVVNDFLLLTSFLTNWLLVLVTDFFLMWNNFSKWHLELVADLNNFIHDVAFMLSQMYFYNTASTDNEVFLIIWQYMESRRTYSIRQTYLAESYLTTSHNYQAILQETIIKW